MKLRNLVAAILLVAVPATGLLAQSLNLPVRQGARPFTTDAVPHVQIAAQPNPALSQELLRQVASLPGVELGETGIGFPGSVGFHLSQATPVAQPRALVRGREFGHLHPDGSLHVSLDPVTARQAIAKGWAISHPWASRRPGWDGFVLLYTPTNRDELSNILVLLADSYRFVTGAS